MRDKEIELAWKAAHGELPASAYDSFLLGLDANEAVASHYEQIQVVDQHLKQSGTSDEQWLEGLTARILDQMEREENQSLFTLIHKRMPQVAALAAALAIGLFSFNVWVGSPKLNWENPEVISPQYRATAAVHETISAAAIQAWHEAYQAEVNDLYATVGAGKSLSWTLALRFEEVDEGLRVEINAQSSQLQNPVRSWTFYAADLEKLDASRKAWAAVVVRGIVVQDP